jgi:hypothetical protein
MHHQARCALKSLHYLAQPPACLPACLPVCLDVYLPARLPAYLPICLPQVIISADVLAGHVGASGLVCDLLGGQAGDWCSNRELAAGVVVLCFMAPLITPKRLSSTVVTRCGRCCGGRRDVCVRALRQQRERVLGRWLVQRAE